jgi:hypothetical protein
VEGEIEERERDAFDRDVDFDLWEEEGARSTEVAYTSCELLSSSRTMRFGVDLVVLAFAFSIRRQRTS